MSEGVAVLDGDGIIRLVNQSAADMVGARMDQVLGQRLLDLRWHAVDEDGALYPHADHPALLTLRTGLPLSNIVMGVYRIDRSLIWLSVNTRPLFRPGETKPYAVVASYTDFTRRKAAEERSKESESRFRRLSDASLDGVAISVGGLVREANRAMCDMFGYSFQEIIGMSYEELVAPETRHATKVRVEEELEGSYNSIGVRKDGTRFPIRIHGRPIQLDGKPARVAVVKDLQEFEKVDRLKHEFVSIVSHELRTPLTAMRGALGLLDGGAVGEIPPRARELVRVGLNNVNRLIGVVNSILDLEKFEAGRVTLALDTVDPSECINTALSMNQRTADQREIALMISMETTARVYADQERLIQVLDNLISNAVKFSLNGGTVVVRVADENKMVRFEVIDQGTGIAPQMFDRLFRRFSQVDSSDARRQGGTGLGLAVARSIVEAHGGKIAAESEPDVRTVFWFTIPKATPAQ